MEERYKKNERTKGRNEGNRGSKGSKKGKCRKEGREVTEGRKEVLYKGRTEGR